MLGWLGFHLTNVQRGAKYRPDTCKWGHPYPESAGVRPNGYFYCLACQRERRRKK